VILRFAHPKGLAVIPIIAVFLFILLLNRPKAVLLDGGREGKQADEPPQGKPCGIFSVTAA
jgi:hypothetical protein